MKYLWSVVCLDGRKFKDIEGENASEVLSKLGLEPSQVKKWYPFPTKRVLTEEERVKQAARLKQLNEHKQRGKQWI